VFKNAPAGLLYSGDAGFDGKTGSSRRYNQFAPRVGLSFDPGGDQKTVIRVAAGIAYDFPNVQIASTPATAPPFGNAITGVPGPAPFADPWSIYPGGNPFPGNFGGPDSAFVRGNYMAVEPDAKATTVYSWNASIQHQFGGDLLLSATYMGNQMRHIWGTKQLNPAVILNCGTGVAVSVCNTTGNVDARRISAITNPSAGGGLLSYVDSFDSGGTGNYHGLLLAMAKRMSRNVSFQANYTWSHCIADINAASWVGGVGLGLLDPNNRAFDRGNCQTMVATGLTQSLDRRHIANITAVYETPKISTGMVRRAVSDWRISTSIRANSGSFVTPTLGTDGQRIGAGGGTLRPNQIAPTPLTANHGSQCAGIATTCIAWLDPSSFQVAADYPVGSLPNLGRSSVPGPAFWQMDMAVSRIFRLKEAMSLEARGEAFNLTNAVRWGNPTLGRNSPQFGQILSAQDPRIMQLALKFVF
jgi:hypothetical protein